MMRASIRLWCIVFILINSTFALSKDSYQPKLSDPLSEGWRYTFFDYLDNNGVRCVARSNHEDHYWFGTTTGVELYDGHNWFHFGEESGLDGSPVSNIYVDRDDSVYVTTAKGIYEFQSNKWRPIFKAAASETYDFLSIEKLSDGSIACGFLKGLILISKESKFFFSCEEYADSFIDNHPDFLFVDLPREFTYDGTFDNISDIFEFDTSKIWLAISKEERGDILEFKLADALDGHISDYKIIGKYHNIKLGNHQTIYRARNGKIWIINKSNKTETITYYRNKWEYQSFNSLFGDDEYAISITESEDGTIWIGSIGKVYAKSGDEWKKYSAPSFEIPAAHITTYSNREGELLLVGYLSNALKIDLSDDQWLTYEELNFQCELENGSSWFIDVYGKAIHNENNKWTSYSQQDGMIEHPVRIFYTSKGQLWAVGTDKGAAAVAYFENDRWHKTHFDTLSWGIDSRSVYEASDGSIWFGGSVDIDSNKGHKGGLVRIINPTEKDKKWVMYPYREKGLNQSNVYGVAQGKNGNIYIGGGRLHWWNGTEWLDSDINHLQQFINNISSDEENNLYVGSRYYGLYIFDGEQWTNYSNENGLVSNTIISICAKNNKIWLATDKDISFYNGNTWINHAFPKEMNLTNEGGSIRLGNSGEVWINHSLREWKRRAYNNKPLTKQVFDKFKVYRKIPDQNAPVVEISVFTERVDNSGNTLISWKGKDHFNETPKSRLLYSYKLNDLPWTEFSNKTNHTFTGLASGEYRLEVIAMDLDGNTSVDPAVAEFIVIPPVWKQTWFILLIISFIILISIFEYRIITKNKTLSVLNTNLQDLVTQLDSKGKKIEKQNEKIIKHQEKLEENNQLLESKNHEIEAQRDALKDLLVHVENLSKAKVKFFTNITHEFRTPLSLIIGPVETLSQSDNGNEEKQSLYHIIKKNALRLQKLINQLLEIRRIETGTMELILRKENLIRYIRDIKELFNNQSVQKCITFNFTSDVDHYEIYFDQDKIEKIVFNLLSNAFKYTSEYGTISVILKVNNFKNQDDKYPVANANRYIKLIVKDTGRGIESHRLENIFERYKNVDQSLNISNMESTGIGLSYIKDLIEFHEGKIFVESEIDKGTTFTLFLPKDMKPNHVKHNKLAEKITPEYKQKSLNASLLESEEEDNQVQTSQNGKTKQQGVVLIVEDNMDMRQYLKHLLEKKYTILTAENGKKGLELISETDVDLIISDIMMPEIDGLKFCDNVKSTFETSHIPVILLTAKTLKESELTGYESGADDYITKPFDPNILELKVNNILESREKLKRRFTQEFKFKPKEINVTSADEILLNKLVEIMEENISDAEFDVNKMCDMVNLSHMHFIRKVKQLTGKKPIELLKSFRLQRARQLLEQDKLNISEVAYMVGYDLPNSFSRAFKKEFGISPTEFVSSKLQST